MRPLTASALMAMATVFPVASSAQHAPCTVPASTRSASGFIYGTLTPIGDKPLPRDYAALLLQSMGQGYHGAEPPTLTEYDVTDSIATAAAYASAQFTVTDIGRVRDVKLTASSLSPSFDQSLLATIYAADSNGLVPPFPDGVHGHRTFELQLEAGAITDEQLNRRDTSNGVVARWVTTAIPVWDSAHAIRHVTGKGSPPVFFEPHLISKSDIALRFAVGTNGHMVSEAVELQPGGPSPSNLPITVRSISYYSRYQPATIAGCAVPAVAFQTFHLMFARRLNQPGDPPGLPRPD